ncbi:hypothetical protein [Rufibacter hautae]|uniref:Uncharacterized protein n=1 Tax=Rufibacter hautae TaxID=2595005 RepID=A0A5B6TGR7_9BACT|nr:hypothetical protein [Rufibacter hautae]KAA3438452.1 hypothetical protein FOA19_14550 [Rufibacter hautae]
METTIDKIMNPSNWEAYAAVYAAVLSTILALNSTLKKRKYSSIRLFIECRETKDKKEINILSILVANVCFRPVTITEISFGIGNDYYFQTIIYTHKCEPAIEL